MQTRQLGRSGLTVSALGLGCMGMSDFYGQRDDAESLRTLARALELGVSFFDTADMYGPYTNEELLGSFFSEDKTRRHKVVLATKFGIVRDPNDPSKRGISGRPEYVRQSAEGSLKRLGTDHIDLYYQHRVDPSVPIEETVGAMSRLVEEGKVRFLGLSEAGAETLRKAHATHPISALQTEYSLWSRDVEVEILPTLRELGIGLVPYSPLGRGFLTGEIQKFEDFAPDDYRRHSPRFQGENFAKNLKLVSHLRELAASKGVTASQLALAWVLAQGDDLAPIPGTKRVKYLEENVGALNVTLTADELRHLNELLPLGAAAGQRYPEAMMAAVGR
ncbi:aldo/keto reductase [Hymenobacter ginsengisoli]|uniref:Aldo/keto reductase n=1 Tax=Hymenobacter ginsengisoli TaxID=1051626 RepID=A0ABP8Q7W7_9BACT|nr:MULTISPECIES: aldo/keto reductase [unclassified Hymenobacter]MBO2033626.1 aldo/keto reductase [Hymenobacter sp. BT559]